MSEQTVIINEEEHNVSELAVETQAHIARVNELRQEIGRLQMQISEREVVLQAYTKAIVESVQPVEEVEGEVVN
jgi:hypothetical protein